MEILENLLTEIGSMDMNFSETLFRTMGSSLCSGMSNLIPIILDIIILALVQCPLYGLRIIPIYGKYYFYKMLIPERKALAILHIVIGFFEAILVFIIIIATIVAYSTHGKDYKSTLGVFLMLIFLLILLALCRLTLRFVINYSLAERFGMHPLLGILFTFIPFIGTICYLIFARNAVSVPDYIDSFDNVDRTYDTDKDIYN